MEKIQLSILFKIIGLGSASGLIYNHNTIFAIGDNSTYLYEYQMDSNQLNRHPLVENPKENIVKKSKFDFESLTQYQDTIYIFGSGSTVNRNTMLRVNAATKKVVATNDLSDLYQSMQSFEKITPEDFNIEGVIYNGESWLFLNRGNGKNNKNIIFTVDGKNLTDDFRILSNAYKLPKINGVRTSFTDAILVDNTIYFLATAEKTESTFNDGDVLGSIIGSINLESMKINFTQKISDSHKFEGLTLFKKTETEIEFLLCEDNDTEIQESIIYKLTLTNRK